MSNVSPVLGQLSKSGYVFTFQLPTLFTNFFGRVGNAWFLRVLHRVGRWQKTFLTGTAAAEAMAASVGPGLAECHPNTAPKDASSGEELSYPSSVAKRIATQGWHNKLRIYRDGLFLSPWPKSLETLFALSTLDDQGKNQPSPQSPRRPSTTGLFDTGPPGSLQAPATVVYGMKDPAFETRLGLEGMSDYLVRRSQVVLLERGGHWLPLEKNANRVLEEIILWSLEGEKVPLGSSLAIALEQSGEGVKIAVDT
jgi:pimeloyl-ACP methyl ester carboxylesterase